MSYPSWLDGGPEEWNLQYLASKPWWLAGLVALGFIVMPLVSKR